MQIFVGDLHFCAAQQIAKQCALVFQVEKKLWVPLHANQKFLRRVFYGLYDAIQVTPGDNQPLANAINALIVQTIDA